MRIQDVGKHGISVSFDGKSITLNVTKYTTCDDVIHMVLLKAGVPESKSKSFALFERTSDLDRMLSNKTRVLKTWKSWGCEARSFDFLVKRRDASLSLKKGFCNKSASEAETNIDALFIQHYKSRDSVRDSAESSYTRLSDGDSIMSSDTHCNISGDIRDHKCNKLGNMAFSLDKTKHTERKTVNLKPEAHRRSGKTSGKRALLTRYFNDLLFHNKRKDNSTLFPVRERGDGAEETESLNYRRRNEESNGVHLGSPQFDNLKEKCKYYWENNYQSDSDSDSDITDDLCGDISENECSDLDETVRCRLDTAFVKSSRDSESDEGIDVTSNYSDDLNTAFVDNLKNAYTTEENITINTDDSVQSAAISELETNISKDDFIRKMFGRDLNASMMSQDDEMDSFMMTMIESP